MRLPIQGSLFDLPKETKAEKLAHAVDTEALSDLAFLYAITSAGTNSGIRFMATLEDAKKWCSDDSSKGVYMGTEWAYAYTSVANFIKFYYGDCYSEEFEQPVLNISKLYDNGKWDGKIAAAGCKKIGLNEFAGVLEPLGVMVVRCEKENVK